MKISKNDIKEFKKDITFCDEKYEINEDPFEKKVPSISFLIIAKNEERVIGRCIKSIKKGLDKNDEIILVDTGSTDNTIAICEKLKDQYLNIFNFEWNDDFSEARNYALNFAEKEWAFFIDADEYIEDNSISQLKKSIVILKNNNVENIFINPTIVNSNDHIINGVTRIFENFNNVQYRGLVHEYPSIDNKMITRYAFESVILYHDGYDSQFINMEEKVERNLYLLEEMKKIQENIRWDYLYCRDGSYLWSDNELILQLETFLSKWKGYRNEDVYYSATRDLIELYIHNGLFKNAEKQLTLLKKLNVNESDVVYFDNLIEWLNIKYHEKKILKRLMKYRKTRNAIDYGALHSNYYHIDFLISQLLWGQGELEKGFRIQKKLNRKGVFDYTIDFKQLKNITSQTDNEVYNDE